MLKKSAGFTLVEAIVTLAVVAILISIATPSFISMIHGQQLRSASIDLALALITARHESIMRKKPVMIVNQDGQWGRGWQVFVDQNTNGILDAEDFVLKEKTAVASDVLITGNGPVGSYVRYTPLGRAKMVNGAFQAGTITLCHKDGKQSVRRLILSATGRLRTVQEAAGNC